MSRENAWEMLPRRRMHEMSIRVPLGNVGEGGHSDDIETLTLFETKIVCVKLSHPISDINPSFFSGQNGRPLCPISGKWAKHTFIFGPKRQKNTSFEAWWKPQKSLVQWVQNVKFVLCSSWISIFDLQF